MPLSSGANSPRRLDDSLRHVTRTRVLLNRGQVTVCCDLGDDPDKIHVYNPNVLERHIIPSDPRDFISLRIITTASNMYALNCN